MRTFIAIALFTFVLPLANAEDVLSDDLAELSAFLNYIQISGLDLTVPTVVEIPFDSSGEIAYEFAVLENESDEFQPWYLKTALREVITTEDSALIDEDTKTYTEYELPEDGYGEIEIVLTAVENFSSSSLNFVFDRYVAYPTKIEIQVVEADGSEKVILAREKLTSSTVNFPLTQAKEWHIFLEYSQLLRINELELVQEDGVSEKSVRFLAQPNSTYKLYLNADGAVDIETGEAGDLSDDKGVKRISTYLSQPNPLYQKADTDEDGVANEVDNCVNTSNADQTDEDSNGRGDSCDDYDRDGDINSKDNCPNDPNAAQEDEDGDGLGDACDDEESRFTEKNPWLPWLGMGLATVVIAILFYRAVKPPKLKEEK